MVAYGSLGYACTPADEGDAYAALIGTALDASQFPVSAKEGWVCPTLFVRSIVAGEDNERILIEPFFL